MVFRKIRETDIQMIGILASHADINSNGYGDKQPVFMNKLSDIQYQVKALSENAPHKLFTGYISSILNNEDLDVYQDAETPRVDNFTQRVRESLFLFTYYKSMGSAGGDFYKLSEAVLVPKPEQIDADTVTIATPVYSPRALTERWETEHHISLYRSYNSYEGFLGCIQEKKTIGKVAHFEGRDEFPRFLVWDDGAQFCAVGPFIGAKKANTGWVMQYEELYALDLSDLGDYLVYEETANPSILHMSEKMCESVYNSLLKREGVRVLKQEPTSVRAQQADSTHLPPHRQAEAAATQEALQETEADTFKFDPHKKDDHLLLQLFRYCAQGRELFYHEKDLANFHTAMKTGSLVILSGMSGTGKSALVDVYAKALGISSERQLTIPVRPSWNDDSDLLGYIDLVHRVYRPSDTGFIKFIVEASRYPDELYIVCLDEMNLARVEHYFSQFLSILEKPIGQRVLRLYDAQYKGALYNAVDYPDVIELHDNIKFVGTVNTDESTYHFADKVLDRANIIHLQVVDYVHEWKTIVYPFQTKMVWTKQEYADLVKVETPRLPEIRSFLWQLHTLLNESSNSLGVGPRVVVGIERYLNNRPQSAGEFSLSLGESLDYQVKQRVFTKLRGSEEQFGKLFDEGAPDAIPALLDRHQALSDFASCKQALRQKKKELTVYGYCV